MKIAGLDVGTTGCKFTVFDENGKYLDNSYREYLVIRKMGKHEINAEEIIDNVFDAILEMTHKYSDIEAIGVTSFGETFVMTDKCGKALHSSMLYTDPRGRAECEKLKEELGEMEIAKITGLRPHEMYSISKIMWIKNNKPKLYNKAKHIFLIEDFITFRLTRKAQIDYSLASRTMAFDIRKFEWSENIFKVAGVNINLMSKLVKTGEIAGSVTAMASKITKLSTKTKVISISHDQVAAAVGAGAFDSSIAVDGAGTVECITPVFDSIPDLQEMYKGYYATVPYVIPGKYVAYAFSYTGGALMQWCTNTLAKKEIEIAKKENISVHKYLEKKSKSPTGLLVLPHFSGAATPYMDTGSKGAILGLDSQTTVADIYRGCMEGVVYEMYLNMEYLKSAGVCFNKFHATGGGAHSAVWMQMKADILNLPMISFETVDAGTVGSAMITAVSVGIFDDLKEAATNMLNETAIYKPRPKEHNKYMKIYEKYKDLYESVRHLMR